MDEAWDGFPSTYKAFPYGYGSRRVEAGTTLEVTMSAHQSEFTPAHWVGQTSLGSPELRV